MGKTKGAELTQAMPGVDTKKEQDYETEGHLRTLGDAADIMGDSDKLERVHKLAGRKHKGVMGLIQPAMDAQSGKKPIKSLQDLKDRANKAQPDDEGM